MSIEQCVSPFFKVLRTLGFFSVLRAIDMHVLTDLKRFCFSDVAPSQRNAPRV